MTKERREGEANGPQGQRLARVSRGGRSWTEFVRLADQAVVAFGGAGMTNRAEPRACGYSRGPRRLDTEPETERNAGSASNEAGDGFGRAQDDKAGFQPYWGKPAVRNEPRGWRNRGHDLMAICHDARKGRYSGSYWSKPARLHSTRPIIFVLAACQQPRSSGTTAVSEGLPYCFVEEQPDKRIAERIGRIVPIGLESVLLFPVVQ
jgi:hypothetical protein